MMPADCSLPVGQESISQPLLVIRCLGTVLRVMCNILRNIKRLMCWVIPCWLTCIEDMQSYTPLTAYSQFASSAVQDAVDGTVMRQ